ncbi:hypothetical protein D9M70_492590 [compost metagenome]
MLRPINLLLELTPHGVQTGLLVIDDHSVVVDLESGDFFGRNCSKNPPNDLGERVDAAVRTEKRQNREIPMVVALHKHVDGDDYVALVVLHDAKGRVHFGCVHITVQDGGSQSMRLVPRVQIFGVRDAATHSQDLVRDVRRRLLQIAEVLQTLLNHVH